MLRVGIRIDPADELCIKCLEVVFKLFLPHPGGQDYQARQRADHQGIKKGFKE